MRTGSVFIGTCMSAFLTACGGGGGSSGAESVETFPIQTLQRINYTSGDSLTYEGSIRGDSTQGETATFELTQNYSVAGLAFGTNAKPNFQFVDVATSVSTGSGTSSSFSAFARDTAGALYILDDENGRCFVTEDDFDAGRAPLYLPSVMQPGLSSDDQVTMACDDGRTLQFRHQFSVSASDQISTGAGDFDVVRVDYLTTSIERDSIGQLREESEESGVLFVHPALGRIVEMGTLTVTQALPQTDSITVELVDFNVQDF